MAVAHLIGVIAKQPHALPLLAGELVTTGTLTAALPINAGQSWTTKLDGFALPGISVSFEVQRRAQRPMRPNNFVQRIIEY